MPLVGSNPLPETDTMAPAGLSLRTGVTVTDRPDLVVTVAVPPALAGAAAGAAVAVAGVRIRLPTASASTAMDTNEPREGDRPTLLRMATVEQ